MAEVSLFWYQYLGKDMIQKPLRQAYYEFAIDVNFKRLLPTLLYDGIEENLSFCTGPFWDYYDSSRLPHRYGLIGFTIHDMSTIRSDIYNLVFHHKTKYTAAELIRLACDSDTHARSMRRMSHFYHEQKLYSLAYKKWGPHV